MRMCHISVAWLVVLGFDGGLVSAGAASSQREQLPLKIKSDKMVLYREENRAVFSGNVKLVQGDLEVSSPRLEVFYDSKKIVGGDDAPRGVARMVFSGGVHIRMEKQEGFCRKAIYLRTRHRIDCTGDAWVRQGDNRLSGALIKYHMREGKVEIERPRAVFRLEEGRVRHDGKSRKTE
ncbi:MAG: hypothetical protein D6806_11315 [Deltaproteobacteria bacterium]|nr:MAG: hypothetical protein D6806_11315 [Deltaproteobacteria bacterium]